MQSARPVKAFFSEGANHPWRAKLQAILHEPYLQNSLTVKMSQPGDIRFEDVCVSEPL